jgi:anaerobic selenocysteine-containing dehydrogenase
MNVHSTLNSYLQRLVWVLTGHYGRAGTNNAIFPLLPLSQGRSREGGAGKAARSAAPARDAAAARTSPVLGWRVIMGLIPCNVIPDEILTDHPRRFRAMLIESSNPAHSLADTPRMRQALRALDLSVVIDVAMTETARQADYVLPASSQFEKAEATFFNHEVARNAFHLRQPVLAPRAGTLSEAEIHARLLEAMGEIGERDYTALRRSARLGLVPYALHFAWVMARRPRLARLASVLLYRTLGPSLPEGMAPAASLWGIAQQYVRKHRAQATAAGFGGNAIAAGNRLFRSLLGNPSGQVFAVSQPEDSWAAIGLPNHRIKLDLPELLAELASLGSTGPIRDREFPFVLSAGERRSECMNTAVRDDGWHRKGALQSALRIHPDDARALGAMDGELVRLSTRTAAVVVPIEVTDAMQPGHVSLPNGHGLDIAAAGGGTRRVGVALNELTWGALRDPFAGTPWHKHVPAKLEAVRRSVVVQEAALAGDGP